jgi:hypothetical protein
MMWNLARVSVVVNGLQVLECNGTSQAFRHWNNLDIRGQGSEIASDARSFECFHHVGSHA